MPRWARNGPNTSRLRSELFIPGVDEPSLIGLRGRSTDKPRFVP